MLEDSDKEDKGKDSDSDVGEKGFDVRVWEAIWKQSRNVTMAWLAAARRTAGR